MDLAALEEKLLQKAMLKRMSDPIIHVLQEDRHGQGYLRELLAKLSGTGIKTGTKTNEIE